MDPLFVWQHHDLFQQAGFSLARRFDRPLMLFVDAPQVWEAEKWGVRRPGWGRLVERAGEAPQLREADLVACVSEDVATAVIERGADPGRVVVTPCTADSVRWSAPTGRKRVALRFEDHIVIGWIGSFRPFHNAEAVIEAVSELQQTSEQRVALVMIGDGPTLDACRERAMELEIRDHAFTGRVPHSEVAEYLEAIDIALVPSSQGDAFHYSPLKLKEFLAAGKAVVAPAVGEMAAALSDGRDALLYEAGDRGQMVAQATRLVDDPDLRHSLGRAARNTYDAMFTIDPQLDLVASRLGIPSVREQDR